MQYAPKEYEHRNEAVQWLKELWCQRKMLFSWEDKLLKMFYVKQVIRLFQWVR